MPSERGQHRQEQKRHEDAPPVTSVNPAPLGRGHDRPGSSQQANV